VRAACQATETHLTEWSNDWAAAFEDVTRGERAALPSHMKKGTLIGLAVALAVLLYGTVMVFEAFDRNSNSASDTIRPFVITMGPVWALAIAASIVLLRRRSP
jgi:hypothetical protein